MGTDWSARAVIGVEITKHVPRTEQVSGCVHRHASKFCPECGRPASTTVHINLEEWIDARLGKVLSENRLGYCSTTDDQRVFVGFMGAARTSQHDDAKLTNLGEWISHDSIRLVIERALDPLGFFDPTTFGLWTVMHCSY